jgi:hypothetical protein
MPISEPVAQVVSRGGHAAGRDGGGKADVAGVMILGIPK